MSRSDVVGFISRVTRKIVIGSGRQYLSERGANQRAGEPNGDGGLRYGRKVPEGGAGGNGGDAGSGGGNLAQAARGAMSPYVAEIIHSQTPDCDADCKGKLAEDVAKRNAVVSAHLAGTVRLGILPKGLW